jgi:hypothetical protein
LVLATTLILLDHFQYGFQRMPRAHLNTFEEWKYSLAMVQGIWGQRELEAVRFPPEFTNQLCFSGQILSAYRDKKP